MPTTAPERSCTAATPVEPDSRRRLYAVLAARLASAAAASSIVIETASGRRPPSVTVRPESLWSAPERGIDRELVPPREPSPARRRGALASWDLVAGRDRFGASPDPPLRELLPQGGPPFRVQTLWVRGRGPPLLWVARRIAVGSVPGESPVGPPAVLAAAAAEWSRRVRVTVGPVPASTGSARDWSEAAWRSIPRPAWFTVPAGDAAPLAEPELAVPELLAPGHTMVFGSTGAGKTWFLAESAARRIRAGGSVLAIDLHGDLGPSLVARLGERERARLVGVDAGSPQVVGIAALHGSGDRAAGHFVSAVKRLSPDGEELYWGFRLERLFDAFVRIVQDSDGTLLDLYGLLTDVDRREVARLTTRRPELARFLDELAPITRRSPDFLWPAAARLAKVALLPALSELLAPADGGIDLEGLLLEERRSVVVRLPFSDLGTEAAAFAASLVLARSYFGLISRGAKAGGVLAVVDEAHGLSPRLLTEMLTEGRKFGVRLLLASQYPERLAPELRAAVAGAVGDVLLFRTPAASAAIVGRWLGLAPGGSEAILPALATGVAVRRSHGSGDLVVVPPSADALPAGDEAWSRLLRASRAEFGGSGPRDLPPDPEPTTERILLAILAAEEEGAGMPWEALADAVARLPGPPLDPAAVLDRARTLEQHRLIAREEDRLVTTPGGLRALGLLTATGATRESAEHRALLLRAFRVFARHGCRLEIVRQGRYDTALPDGRFRQLRAVQGASPLRLAEELDRIRRGWAWRYFGGRDVHVEAEVSGALRKERIRRGCVKAARRDAYVLFLVADAGRGRRVRRALAALGLGRDRAGVWVLNGSGPPRPPLGPAPPATERANA